MSERPPVGIVGVGAIGLALTERLVAAGYAVGGFRRGDLASFRRAGGTPASSAAAVAMACDPLLLLVPAEAGLMAVMAEISPVLRRGQVVLCLATHRVAAKQAAAAIAGAAGAVLIDGEISGTPDMVRAGAASVMVAGDGAAIERVRDVLAAFAARITRLATFGDAVKMKLVTNYLVAVHTLAAAEALQMAGDLALPLDTAVAAIAPSAGGSTMWSVRGPMMAARAFPSHDSSGFLHYFDLLRDALAEGGAGRRQLLDLTEQRYRAFIAAGHGQRDIAAIYETLDP